MITFLNLWATFGADPPPDVWDVATTYLDDDAAPACTNYAAGFGFLNRTKFDHIREVMFQWALTTPRGQDFVDSFSDLDDILQERYGTASEFLYQVVDIAAFGGFIGVRGVTYIHLNEYV